MCVLVILFREIAIREISLFRTDMVFIPICSICVESGDAEVWVLRMYPHNELTQSEDFFFKPKMECAISSKGGHLAVFPEQEDQVLGHGMKHFLSLEFVSLQVPTLA